MLSTGQIDRILVIPTNRPLLPDAKQTIVEAIARDISAEIPVLVVDSSNASTFSHNRTLLTDISSNCDKALLFHAPSSDIDDIFDAAYAGDTFRSCPWRDIDSYGISTNRAFLGAVALGARHIHKRDSDVFLPPSLLPNYYPIEIEIDALGSTVGDFADSASSRYGCAVVDAELFCGHEIIFAVGGGYTGKMAADYEDLLIGNPKAFARILSLPLIGRDAPVQSGQFDADALKSRFLHQMERTFLSDSLTVAKRCQIEGGNSSYYDIFHQVPVSPAELTLGVDYFFLGLLKALGLPRLSHGRLVHHIHTSERSDSEWEAKYQIGLALTRLDGFVYNELFKLIERNQRRYYVSGSFNANEISETLHELADAGIDTGYILEEYCNALANSGLERYEAAAGLVQNMREMLVTKILDDARSHARLIEIWPKLTFDVGRMQKHLWKEFILGWRIG